MRVRLRLGQFPEEELGVGGEVAADCCWQLYGKFDGSVVEDGGEF